MKTLIAAAMLALLSLPAWGQTPYVPTARAKAPPKAASPAVWPRLTAEERKNIANELRPGGQIVVACNSTNCRGLAGDVVAVFKAAGWQTSLMSHGGMGIDGVVGIRADSCGIGADRLKEAIERVTTRQVDVTEDGACSDPHLYLVIGTRE